MRVHVHRDIRGKIYSVTVRGRVVEKPTHAYLTNVTFKVRPGGRARVLKERRKNVHAFVVGDLVETDTMNMSGIPTEAVRVKYDPYACDRFFDPETGEILDSAKEVWLTPLGVWAMV